MRYDLRMKSTVLLSLLFFAALAQPAGAEVEKFVQFGDGQLNPYFRLKFTPPQGWVLDAKATQENGLAMYVPKGMNFGNAPALMYIRVSYNSDKRSMEKFIEVAHERWKNTEKDSKIEKLASEKRANGKPDFQVYHFVNPSNPQQAYELMAYGEDTDKDGNSYFLMIGLTAAAQKAIDAAEADYRAGLGAH
ncbi:MAG TPA: hypothetical protein VKT73_10130 [Xanthobacteraceae bacterium]|nr:hypothetical protein [Xanthobacteraceae bacterium]